MGTYVTESGLKRKTLQELRVEFENKFKQVFGVTFETAVDSPNGLLVSQLALSYNDLWELAQEIYSSLDPNQAVGAELDARAAFNGVSRKPALPCTVDAVLYTSGDSATIPAGSLAKRQRGNLNFSLDETVTISRASCDELMIVDNSSAKNTEYVFHFTFGDVTLNNSTSASNISVLASAIASAGGTATETARGLRVYDEDCTPVGITGTMPDDFIILSGKNGDFTAVDLGYQTCEIGELDTIAVGVSGWNSVYNYVAGDPGEDLESDESLRVRRAAAARMRKSRATDPAIEAALLDVRGVSSALVKSNRGFDTDSDGIPGKAFTSLVIGGNDNEIAQCIYENQPAGIQSYGNTSVNITDSHGIEQQISFSRPTAVYLWVKVTYSLYDEEAFTGQDAVKAALVEWAEREYTLGKDVISTRINQGLYDVPGIGVATCAVAVTENPDTPPSSSSYETDKRIPVSFFSYAALEDDRISFDVLQNS
jgi:Uncharacterized homolog of phage Mu protein gp47